MRMIGDEIWALVKKVLARLAARQRRMGKKKWSDGIDVRPLSGEEWLRLFIGETDMTKFVGWCERCRTGKLHERTRHHCGGNLLLFDERFWCQISRKIRRALQKDRTLLSRAKSEREDVYGTKYKPMFPTSLEWLAQLWEQTPAPPYQSFGPKMHYQVSNWIESLKSIGLSKEEIIEVLGDNELLDGPLREKRKDYAKLSKAELLQMRMDFRKSVGGLPSSVKGLPEMWRTTTWVDRQRTTPNARLRGERVRERNSAKD